MDKVNIKTLLDAEALKRNSSDELTFDRPDPLLVAKKFPDELFALTCALFAYGNARSIVTFLDSLSPIWMEEEEETLRIMLRGKYYRFQSTEDIVQWHITLKRLKVLGGTEKLFLKGYESGGVVSGLRYLIDGIYDVNPYRSQGYRFLIGSPIHSVSKVSAMKRWMMYLRWMVRKDSLDLGLWKGIDKSELIMPLDTHTFKVARQLGLLSRRQCDLKAALELTEALRLLDPDDPVRYDFALYRIGQEKLLKA